MTDKNRRQRGTRTRGGGTHKNRRGAGNRGGRGAAGRDKHEFHGHEPLGKYGFTRPEDVTREVLEVDLQTLDENAPLYAAEGIADEVDGGYRFDARDVVDGGHAADVVKVLGNGRARHRLEVTADDFSATAVERIKSADGSVTYSERARDDTTEE
jgi:large subunit ribosomal protein L15